MGCKDILPICISPQKFSASFAFNKHLCTVSTIEECSSNFQVFSSKSFEIWLFGNFFLMNQIFLSYRSHQMILYVVWVRCLLKKSNFMLVNTCDYRGFILLCHRGFQFKISECVCARVCVCVCTKIRKSNISFFKCTTLI